mgnify:CR=1 FL=1
MSWNTNRPHLPAGAALALVLLGVCAAVGSTTAPARAQTALGDPADLRFAVVNGTTLRGDTIERLTVEYLTQRPNLVLEIEPADTAFTAAQVPVLDSGKYLLTAWRHGVPYFFSRRGRELKDGVQTLHVFETTTDLDAVRIAGMTMVLKREESLLGVEIMLQIHNDARPQVTVVGSPGPVTLDLPPDIVEVEAEYHRGLDPTPVAVATDGGACTLAVPLVTGTNRVRLTGTLPWREGRDLVVGANLPVDDWSVMVSPEWMEIVSFELEPDNEVDAAGYRRFKGSALEAGRTWTMRLDSGANAASPAGDVFTESAPAPAEAAADEEGGGIPLPLILAGAVLVVLLLLTTRKRG